MRFQLLALLGLASASAATQWSGMENLPNGAYSGVNHPDGSTTMTSLDLSNRATKQARRSDYAITKRDTSCWGYQLDHTGVDQGVIGLKNWARSGVGLSSGDSPGYYGFNNNGVYVYYCINKAHSSGNLDINDIDYALRQMDANCASYEAGYFLWPNRVELVGKCRSGTPVCLG